MLLCNFDIIEKISEKLIIELLSINLKMYNKSVFSTYLVLK